MSASLGLTAGLDVALWMGFDGSGNEYGIGAMAFVHAWFKASSITCTKPSAEARAELGATESIIPVPERLQQQVAAASPSGVQHSSASLHPAGTASAVPDVSGAVSVKALNWIFSSIQAAIPASISASATAAARLT
ncbi:MAG: hypothetical protein R2758_14410 [Bacteroidales bacterium]